MAEFHAYTNSNFADKQTMFVIIFRYFKNTLFLTFIMTIVSIAFIVKSTNHLIDINKLLLFDLYVVSMSVLVVDFQGRIKTLL